MISSSTTNTFCLQASVALCAAVGWLRRRVALSRPSAANRRRHWTSISLYKKMNLNECKVIEIVFHSFTIRGGTHRYI